MTILAIGILASLLQVAGYAFYSSKMLKRDIRPNAASWLMFAYGTTLLAILEWDRGASFALLVLPVLCAISSTLVAMYALRHTASWWPQHPLERFSIFLDITLTIIYV